MSIFNENTTSENRKRDVTLDSDVTSYGVELSKTEEALLRLPPKYSVYSKLDSREWENQLERLNTKLRYAAKRAEDPSEATPTSQLDAPEPVKTKSGDNLKVDLDQIEAETWTTYNPGQCEVHMSRAKVTNWIQNEHVYLPKAAEPGIEAEIRVRKDLFTETFEQYKQQN